MQLSDQELRTLVRDAIARHTGAGSASGQPLVVDRLHASHLRLPVAGGSDGDGACLIEPAVRCTHCGYCQSLGH